MRITRVRLIELHGELDHDGELWEERVIRPIDVYPEHRHERGYPIASGGPGQERNARGAYPVSSIFVSVETDEGVSGLAGTIDRQTAFVIDTDVAPLVVGEDPLAIETHLGQALPPAHPRAQGPAHVRHQRAGRGAVGPQRQVARAAGLPAAGRSGAGQHPRLRQHAGLFARARPRHTARAARGRGRRLRRHQVVHAPWAGRRRAGRPRQRGNWRATVRQAVGDDVEGDAGRLE